MPEPKKSPKPHPFEAQADDLLEGLRLARKPAAKPGSENATRRKQIPPAPDEPDLVSKLIDFIKTM